MGERPYVVGGLFIVLGYLQAAFERAPRLEDTVFRRDLRRWQYQRLGRALLGGGVR